MKMMSWSRYHCLSWSLMRAAHTRRVRRIHKTRQRRHASDMSPVAAVAGASRFQFLIRMFRTGAWSGYTDV
jgi:hypothetical protein